MSKNENTSLELVDIFYFILGTISIVFGCCMVCPLVFNWPFKPVVHWGVIIALMGIVLIVPGIGAIYATAFGVDEDEDHKIISVEDVPLLEALSKAQTPDEVKKVLSENDK